MSAAKTGKVAIVTGGIGPGLGSGISQVLAKHGWHVVMVDRDDSHADDVLALIEDQGGSAMFERVDLTDEDAPQRCVAAAMNWKGQLDGLVNNAGIASVGVIDAVSDEQLDHTLAINLRAVFRLGREVSKAITQPGGSIVNISSVHGMNPLPGVSAYALTKGGVQALSRAMAVDLGSRGIRVNCVVPGMIDCPQTRRMTSQYVDDVDAYLQKWADTRQLLPDLVKNTDVGELVEFLLSERSMGVTAQSLVIDAGTITMLTDRDPA